MANPEHHTGNVENTAEIARAAAERASELREHEPNIDSSKAEKEIREARHSAEQLAKNAEEHQPKAEKTEEEPASITSESRDKSYDHTMQDVQQHMSAPARVFSKFIHNKSVEEVSDVVGSTVARPNAVLSGAIFAFVLVLALYATARYVGFALSGFETIGAFILGWIIGLIFDFVRVGISGKR